MDVDELETLFAGLRQKAYATPKETHAMTLAQRGRQIPLLFALCAAGVEGAPAGAAEAPAGPAGTPLRVVRYAENVFIRSAFSPAEDLVVQVAKGRNGQANFMGTRLVPTAAGVSQADLSGGRLIHGNGDDSTPWNLNGTYIGANHGCSAGREITCAGHGKAAADLGSEWEDEKGSRFYLIKIVDKDRLWFLPANQGTGAIWRFNSTVAGAALTNKAKGATLAFTKNEMAQVLPACRMKKQEYLVEGRTPLEEGKPVSCTFFDIAEESEIINPGSLLQDLVTHPGTERPFNAGHLDAVVRDRILYRFYPNGANVITYDSKALQEFNLGYMGFIQSAKLTQGQYETHEYYIPKTLPFTQDQIR